MSLNITQLCYITANPEVEKHTQVRLMFLCIRNIDICIYVDIHYEILHIEKASMQSVIWWRDAAWSITKSNILKGITMHNMMGFILLTKMCYAYTELYIKCLYMYCTAVWAIVMNIETMIIWGKPTYLTPIYNDCFCKTC